MTTGQFRLSGTAFRVVAVDLVVEREGNGSHEQAIAEYY